MSEYGDLTITRNEDGTLTATDPPPALTLVSLELIANGDPAVVQVDGLVLTIADLRYRVVGVNDRYACLLCELVR